MIFTTAYDEHAVEAFELHAVDYLLKPFSQERFVEAVQHALQSVAARDAALPALAAAAQAEVEPLTRVLVRDGGKIFPLLVDAIECLRSDTKYTAIVSQGRSHLVRLPLSAFEKRLEPGALPQDQSRLHRQPRLRRGDGSGRQLAARGAAEGRHAGHREPRGLASTAGGLAMKKICFLLGLALLAGLPAVAAAQTRRGQDLPTGPFDSIEISGSADVRFTQGPTDQVIDPRRRRGAAGDGARRAQRQAAHRPGRRVAVLGRGPGADRGAGARADAGLDLRRRRLPRAGRRCAPNSSRSASPAPARPASSGSTPRRSASRSPARATARWRARPRS